MLSRIFRFFICCYLTKQLVEGSRAGSIFREQFVLFQTRSRIVKGDVECTL